MKQTKQQLSEAFQRIKGACVHDWSYLSCDIHFCRECKAVAYTPSQKTECLPHAEDDGLAMAALRWWVEQDKANRTADIDMYGDATSVTLLTVDNNKCKAVTQSCHKDFAAAAIAAIVSAKTQEQVEVSE